MTALEIVGATKRFGSLIALDDARLSVRQGSVHALLGENGAGKTTLLRVAYGLIAPDSGSVSVNGNAVRFARPADAIAAGIGMVPQHSASVPVMTVAENIELGRRGLYRTALVRETARSLAKKLGFSIDVDERVEDLSVAAQQRVEILKAVAQGARILILDEPTAVLAPADATDLLTWLRGFAGGGGTVVVITHKLEEARSYADDLTVLRRGKTVLESIARETTAADLTYAMLGEGSVAVASRSPAVARALNAVATARSVTMKRDGGRVSIADATFDVRRSEIVGVVGVEGSGHHELLLALSRRLPLSGGSLELPERVGFVPENRHRDGVVLRFSLTSNVAIAGAGTRRGRMGWPAIRQGTRDIIEKFDVRARSADDSMSDLSGGNQQKLVLGREVAARPELLVVENPTRGLDIRAAAFIREQLIACRDAGMAVVFYSSDLDEVIDIADRVLVVHAGSVAVMARDRITIGAAMLGVA